VAPPYRNRERSTHDLSRTTELLNFAYVDSADDNARQRSLLDRRGGRCSIVYRLGCLLTCTTPDCPNDCFQMVRLLLDVTANATVMRQLDLKISQGCAFVREIALADRSSISMFPLQEVTRAEGRVMVEANNATAEPPYAAIVGPANDIARLKLERNRGRVPRSWCRGTSCFRRMPSKIEGFPKSRWNTYASTPGHPAASEGPYQRDSRVGACRRRFL
jgi:hypothetical protein